MARIVNGMILLLLGWLGCAMSTAQAADLTCGIALGFPPYQYSEHGQVKGFDADVIDLVMKQLGRQCQLVQAPWDQILNRLRYGKLDLVVGMETGELRNRYFDFTRSYTARKSVIFVNAQRSEITRQEELYGQFIAGDRSSLIEQVWTDQGLHNKFRIRELESKSESMRLLKIGEVQAALMPLEVGIYLAQLQQVPVRVLAEPQVETPVALAVIKGNTVLRNQLDQALQVLINSGKIQALYQRWFGQQKPSS